MCRLPYIYAINTTSQTLADNSNIAFNAVPVHRTNCIGFMGTSFVIKKSGSYEISFDANVDATVTGAVTLQILANGIPIATGLVNGIAGTAKHFHLQSVVNVRPSCKCIDNTTNIQVLLVDGATITNPSILIKAI